jgi:hypothetical protein
VALPDLYLTPPGDGWQARSRPLSRMGQAYESGALLLGLAPCGARYLGKCYDTLGFEIPLAYDTFGSDTFQIGL